MVPQALIFAFVNRTVTQTANVSVRSEILEIDTKIDRYLIFNAQSTQEKLAIFPRIVRSKSA